MQLMDNIQEKKNTEYKGINDEDVFKNMDNFQEKQRIKIYSTRRQL